MHTLSKQEFLGANQTRQQYAIYEAVMSQAGGFVVPPHDNQEIGYNGGGNVSEIIYKNGATVVATKTFTYDDPSSANGKVTNIALTYPS